MNDLIQRRKRLMIASGLLLATGLLAGATSTAGMLMLAAAAVIAGSDIAVRAWSMLRTRQISIELLVTVAAGGALIIGEVVEAAAVTFLFLLGAYLETRTMRRTRQALADLFKMAPERALVVRDGEVEEVPVGQVQPGTIVRVRPGARVSVDGVIVEGHSAVDESSITGEGLPAEKMPGSEVFAGTVNMAGSLDVRATSVGADTALARIIRRVEEAQEEQMPVQRFIDRFARWYTPAMIGMATVTFLITGNIHLALTLLVISCPGALVIATPVAIASGIGRAARRGILVKGGAHLETIGRASALVLDKTGTITEGRPRLSDVIPLAPEPVALAGVLSDDHPDASPSHEERLIRWAAIAEADSLHPLALPITTRALEMGPIPEGRSSEAVAGKGVCARWEGHDVVVGQEDWLREIGIEISREAEEHTARLHESGKTGVLVAVDGTLMGAIGVADTPCPSANEMISRLPDIGIERVVMATGDDERTARAVARQAGITEVHARQLPEDKLNLIRQLQAEGHTVAFAGDGINDAPALAAADIGIAMGAAGADVAVEAADIALMSDELTRVPEAINLSRRTLRIIRQNLVIAVGTALALLVGVLAGVVNMGGGMLVHEASLLVVIFNSLRLLSGGREERQAPTCKPGIHQLENGASSSSVTLAGPTSAPDTGNESRPRVFEQDPVGHFEP